MAITIQRLLKQFPDFKILTGKNNLQENITTVSVMDAPDIYEWMKGGEFLITSGYSFRNNPLYLLKLVSELHKKNVTALGIKMERFIDRLPKEVIDLCNKLNFLIIDIPYSYAFTDIINPVLSNIVNEQATKLEISNNIHSTFTNIVINEEGIDKIIKEISEILLTDIAFINLEFKKIYIHSNDLSFVENVNSKQLHELLNTYYTYKVEYNHKLYGYIIMNTSLEIKLNSLQNITLEHASTVLKLEIQKEISQKQIEQKYRDEFLQDLIFNNIKTIEEVHTRASRYGWRFNKGLLVLIVDIDDYKKSLVSNKINLDNLRNTILKYSKSILKSNYIKTNYTIYSDMIVFLIEPTNNFTPEFMSNLINLSETIKNYIQKNTDFTVTIGIGSYQENITKTYKSFLEARNSIEIGRTIQGNNKIHIYNNLNIYKILLKISSSEDGISFFNNILNPLLEYDNNNNSNLLLTITELINNDWNLKSTSKILFIHYNTILYRFNKICELLNIDLKTREEKFKLELAIKLKSINSLMNL